MQGRNQVYWKRGCRHPHSLVILLPLTYKLAFAPHIFIMSHRKMKALIKQQNQLTITNSCVKEKTCYSCALPKYYKLFNLFKII
jgi:hypothetical protein